MLIDEDWIGFDETLLWLVLKLFKGCNKDLVLLTLETLPILSYTCGWPLLWHEEAGEWFEWFEEFE